MLKTFENLSVEMKNHFIQIYTELELSNVFRYKLNVEKQMILKGKHNFFIQLNKDRTALRRKPQTILTVTPIFNENEFHFNKANEQEKLLIVNFDDLEVTFMINNSPLTKYHSLLCPNITENNPQILTKSSIIFSIQLLNVLSERNWRIGYNSPGALASVNHLHLHLISIDEKLYVENAELIPVTKKLYKLNPIDKINGYCFLVNEQDIIECSEDIFKLVNYFCSENIPHNLFFTQGIYENKSTLRVYIYPRESGYDSKEMCSFNIAFCELSGYLPVGNEKLYNSLSEEIILERIVNDIGNITKMEDKIVELFNK